MLQVEDTPLMQQWREVKSQHRDDLVFFRVGDFYELFYGDAEEGAKILGLTLTSRNNGSASRVPLAGVPVKALDEYLIRLVKAGRRVSICEQVEDPAEAKGIVRREVVETVTPGTVLSDSLLPARRNNFIAAITPPSEGGVHGVATLDVSTGELWVRATPGQDLEDELGRIEPSELLFPRSLESLAATVVDAIGVRASSQTIREDWIFDLAPAQEALEQCYGAHLEGFGFQKDDQLLLRAAGALVTYVTEVRPGSVAHLRPPKIERAGAAMVLDEMTRRNLELVEPLRAGEEGGTLISVLDEAVTAMGARLLRRWLLHPLVAPAEIWARQRAVEHLVLGREIRGAVRDELGGIRDLQRLAGKVGVGRVTPRDLVGLTGSLERLPGLVAQLGPVEDDRLRELADLDVLEDLQLYLSAAISADAPASLQSGGVIAEGFSPELDELRKALDGARDFIATLQVRERARTGISSLKVGFNKVFGYYLEVTKSNLDKVPDDYHRKQTLANAERYFTPELKEWEEKVFGAEDRIGSLETRLFGEVRERTSQEVGRLQETALEIAELDVLSTLAEVAEKRRYVRPRVETGFSLDIKGGRHPVVETMMPSEDFVPNDVFLDEATRIVILTGPNMAGKSTVLRQVGLIQLMAQIGSFVPADEATVSVVDRIFTRVGASDNLARGQSTFMVEMNETAAIVHGATEHSLVLLDEIGRGTSTYDGVSIAWAVTEHVHEHVKAKTIFATHYHELTQLADFLPAVTNRNVAVRESGDEIVFLRRLEEGGADRSYGIQVARLAGFPPELLARARELLTELEGTHTGGGEGLGRRGGHQPQSATPRDQLSFFQVAEHPLVERLREVEIDQMTPLEALNLLHELRTLARGSR